MLAADLKLDTFSNFVQAQRPGPRGTVMIFDQAGSLIAHPDFAEFVVRAMTDPSRSQLPSIDEVNIRSRRFGVAQASNVDNNEGIVRGRCGTGLFVQDVEVRSRRAISREHFAAGGSG